MSFKSSPTAPVNRLVFIDALRGLACLWVIDCHIHAYWLDSVREHGWTLTTLVTRIAGYGGRGVDLFIVLSGFCLFWPLAQPGEKRIFKPAAFFQRRAWRLLPAYYGALLVCFALVSIPAVQPLLVTRPVSWSDLFFHLPLVQTFSPEAVASINGSFWSLALEVQLYLAFPAILWIVRRQGLPYAIAAGLTTALLSWGLEIILAARPQAIPYAGLLDLHLPSRWIEFICGMCAASVVARPSGRDMKMAGVAILALLPLAICSQPLHFPMAVSAPIFGAIFAALIVLASRLPTGWFQEYRAARVATFVGTVSYSLYLLHQPLLLLSAPWVKGLHLSTIQEFALGLFGFVPLAVLLAWGCYRLWEVPFLHVRPPAAVALREQPAAFEPAVRQLADGLPKTKLI